MFHLEREGVVAPSTDAPEKTSDLETIKRLITEAFVRRDQGGIEPAREKNLINDALRYLTGKPEKTFSGTPRERWWFDWLDKARIRTITEITTERYDGHIKADRLAQLHELTRGV